MFKNPDFYYERGCLWWLLEIAALIGAILGVIHDISSPYAWGILVFEALDLVLYLHLRRVRKKDYYKEDSFWLRKDEDETQNQSPQ